MMNGDQKDIISRVSKLRSQCAELRIQLSESGATALEPTALELDKDVIRQFEALLGHRKALETRLGLPISPDEEAIPQLAQDPNPNMSEVDSLRSLLQEARQHATSLQSHVQALESKLGESRTKIEGLMMEREGLKMESVKLRNDLRMQEERFSVELTTSLAKFGVRQTALTLPSPADLGAKLSATEQVLAAKQGLQ